MFVKRLFISAVALLFISTGASAQKKNKKDKGEKEEVILIKTDTVFVDKKTEPPVPIRYRASNTKSNDVLHTKLEVRLDWQNSWLYGKATIDVKPYFYPVKKLYLDARGMDINK